MGEYKTPGVYIKEKNAFGNSVVEAETAIPVFIGLTEKALNGNESLQNKPVRITSMTEYVQYFGGAPTPLFKVSNTKKDANNKKYLECNGLYAEIPESVATLYYHLTLFFANGGATCYIVSVGNYSQTFAEAYDKEKEKALANIKKVQDITMLVVPEAVNNTGAGCMNVYTDLLGLCNDKKYFVILDVPAEENGIELFRKHIGTTNLQCAAAYYPGLETSVLSDNDITDANMQLSDEITTGNAALDEYIKSSDKNNLHNTLIQNWPEYKLLADKIKVFLNHLPPSAAMAGLYTMVDNTRGVWKAPANVSVNYVNKLSKAITDSEQEDLNMPMNGKAINVIRAFPGEGIKVWGARTLDGNSNDWRYINVRRTMTFLEQSVKNAARAYVFEPNDASTWINMKCMIENFLRSVWKRGGLAGATPEDAFEVHVGLGDTMTGEDILEGIMRITVLVAISRPAEFIEITFQQQMQKS